MQIINKLAEKYPKCRIEHLWADEFAGDYGHRVYENGAWTSYYDDRERFFEECWGYPLEEEEYDEDEDW